MKYSTKAGLPPGSLVHIGNKKTEKSVITVFRYNEKEFEEFSSVDIQKLKEEINANQVCWINLDGLHEVEILEKIGAAFELDHLVLEDILNTDHMPKTEESENYGFLTLKMLNFDEKSNSIVSEQVSFIYSQHYLLSFQERQGDVFEPVRDRLRNSKGKVRQKGADYLLYVLIDCVVDRYFYVLEKLSEQLTELEDSIIQGAEEKHVQEIQVFKKQLLVIRRAAYPLRETLNTLTKPESRFVHKKTLIFWRDVQDHIARIIDTLDNQRDTTNSLMDIYLSMLSHKMNGVMKVLTIIATIFIPLTFLAGIYGMNFKNMPELEAENGYYYLLGIMAVTFVIMLYYFRKKDWI